MKRLAVLVLALAMTGCAGKNAIHPGAAGYISGAPTPVQSFASSSYDALVVASAAIDQTRADFLANKFPASAMPTIRSAFNVAVNAYDTAQGAWIAFNTSASNGGTPSQDALSAALGAMNSALAQLTAAKGATP